METKDHRWVDYKAWRMEKEYMYKYIPVTQEQLNEFKKSATSMYELIERYLKK